MSKQSQRKPSIHTPPLHRFKKSGPEFVFAGRGPGAKRPRLVSTLAQSVLLGESGTAFFALLRRVRRLCRQGPDQQVITLLQFLKDEESSQRVAVRPTPAIFVRDCRHSDEYKAAVQRCDADVEPGAIEFLGQQYVSAWPYGDL